MKISGKSYQSIVLCAGLLLAQGLPAASTLSVKWKEQGGQIELNTVCYSHQYGSISYRNCRADAQKQFSGRCTYFSRKLERSTGTQRSEYRKSEQKYCYAARHFGIVN